MINLNSALTHIENDFVNRELHLAALRQVIRGETEQRILVIAGESGIGKTRLMNECREQCKAERMNCAWIDFVEPFEQGYLSFVLQIWEQLGPTGFEALEQTINKLATLGRWETDDARPFPSAQPLPPANAIRAESHITGTTGNVEHDAQVAIGENITQIRADVVNHVALIMNYDDWWMQNQIQVQITAAFRSALASYTADRKVIIFLDSWDQEHPSTDIRQWLTRSFFQWIANRSLPNVVIIVAGCVESALGRLPHPPAHLALNELNADSVRTYWLDRRKLPLEEVDDIVKYSQGFPLLMVMLANRRARTARPAALHTI